MFWKRKKKAPASFPTFKGRVEEFWEWWSKNDQRFFETIEAGRCGDLQSEVSAATNQLGKQFAWVFGPPPEGDSGHSFTLSGEGNIHLQFLTEYWRQRAPIFENWTFYSSRQPGTIDPILYIEASGERFEFGSLWVTPKVETEREKVGITAWHPAFEKVDERTRNFVLFLMLDETLGEYGTDSWLGQIETGDSKLSGAIPVGELRDFLHDLEIENGWKKYPPTGTYLTYQFPSPDDKFLRSDTIAGTTANMKLIEEYLESEGKMDNPISETGAAFAFLSLDTSIFPDGEQVAARADIEEALEEEFAQNQSGRVLGGAIGHNYAYIDLLFFDGERSADQTMKVLRKLDLPLGTALQYFAKGSEGKRRVM